MSAGSGAGDVAGSALSPVVRGQRWCPASSLARYCLHLLWSLSFLWVLRTLLSNPACWQQAPTDDFGVRIGSSKAVADSGALSSNVAQARLDSGESGPNAKNRTGYDGMSFRHSLGGGPLANEFPPQDLPKTLSWRDTSEALIGRPTGKELMKLLPQKSPSLAARIAAAAAKETGKKAFPTVSTRDSSSRPGAGSRCRNVDFRRINVGMRCGSPLAQPCFDRYRCRKNPRIYVYDATCSLADSSRLPPSNESLMLSHTWREVARNKGVLAERYEDACFFIATHKQVDVDPCAASSSLWHGGANHVIVDLSDVPRDRKKALAKSKAMDASSTVLSCYYRSGYDFAVPLRHKVAFGQYTHIPPWDRKYFATVKGSVYLSGYGMHDRMSLIPVHNEADGVVTALSCFELHEEHLLPDFVKFCGGLKNTSSRYDYSELMNTTFGLVPGGRSPATYRLAEVMSAGAIPVFINRDYVKPFPERVDWSTFSFTFAPEDVGPSMMKTLRSVSPRRMWDMQRKSVDAFLDIFGETPGYSRIAEIVIEELLRRVDFN